MLDDKDEFETKRPRWDDDWDDHWLAHMAEQDRKRDRKKEEFDTYLTWSFIVVCWITTIFMVFMKLYA